MKFCYLEFTAAPQHNAQEWIYVIPFNDVCSQSKYIVFQWLWSLDVANLNSKRAFSSKEKHIYPRSCLSLCTSHLLTEATFVGRNYSMSDQFVCFTMETHLKGPYPLPQMNSDIRIGIVHPAHPPILRVDQPTSLYTPGWSCSCFVSLKMINIQGSSENQNYTLSLSRKTNVVYGDGVLAC